jgi:hypothetical protein
MATAGLAQAQPPTRRSVDFRALPSAAAFSFALGPESVPAARPLSSQAGVTADLAATPALPDLNVPVNDRRLDTGDATTQSEVSLAVHGATLCAGYNNSRGGGSPHSFSGFARSETTGVPWQDQGVTAPLLQQGDPALAVHTANGTFYYAEIARLGGMSSTDNLVPIIGVARSTDDCSSFPTLANASPDVSTAQVCIQGNQCATCSQNAECDTVPGAGDGVCIARDVQDKPWIAVDNTGGPRDGNVYVCWTRFVDAYPHFNATSDEIHFSRSTDAGLTFTGEQVISPASDDYPFGCHIVVGPNGALYVAWSDRSNSYPIRFRRSLDGGTSWDDPEQVNTHPIRHPGIDRPTGCETISDCGRRVPIQRPTLNGDIRMLAQAWLAVDGSGGPFNGNIYVTWASDPPDPLDNSDIFLSRSADGGKTWSEEVQIAAGSVTDQFDPFVAVGANGTLSMAWYDRRNDPSHNFNIDLYTAVSRDGGVTFDPISRVTDASFPVPPLTGQPTRSGNFDPAVSACYMGEYIAVAADATNFYYAWGDNRNTVVSAAYPKGRPDPDVFFDRRPAPLVAGTCVGDCDASRTVTVDEVLTMVNIALGNVAVSRCDAGDASRDGQMTVDEILAAVNNALNGCGGNRPDRSFAGIPAQ